MKSPPIILIRDLHKSFGTHKVLNGVNLSVDKGKDLVILGRSGSGKSITIKCLVGLIKPDSGSIQVFGTELTQLNSKELNRLRLKVGFMFQNGALYDSMSVRQNLVFTLENHDKSLTKAQMEHLVTEALDNVGLLEAIDKMPSELSGGMRKRIGLARAIIIKPEIILYDEPTSGLDPITSREISDLILFIQKKYDTTSIIITHDLACAKKTGNKIMMLLDGCIYAEGTYQALEKSEDPWVRSFFL